MAGFMDMMKKASELQSKMQQMQAELEMLEIEGVSGGGVVKVMLNGKGDLKSVQIDDTLMRADQIYAPMQAALRRALEELPPEDPAYRRLRLSNEFLSFIVDELTALNDRWALRVKELGL